MHELGLVNYVVKQVSRIAEENKVEKICSVTLEFGEVSGIVPSYLYSYWDWYTKKFPLFNGTKLLCETIPAEDKFKAIGAYAAKRAVKIVRKSLTGKSAT